MVLMNLIYPCSRRQGVLLGMVLEFLLACRSACNCHKADGIQESEGASIACHINTPLNVFSGLMKHLKYYPESISLVTLAGSKSSSAFTASFEVFQLSSTGAVFENGYWGKSAYVQEPC